MILDTKKLFFIICAIIGYYFFYVEYNNLIKNEIIYFKESSEKISLTNTSKEPKTYDSKVNKVINTNNNELTLSKIEFTVKKGDSLSSILSKFDFSENKIYEIINAIEIHFDPKTLKVNDKIYFYKNENDKVKKIEINLYVDSVLIINLGNQIEVIKKTLKKYSYQFSYEFEIFDSLYADGLKNNLPADILIKLIKLFSFDLDFQRDIRRGTKVSVSYEFDEIEQNKNIEYLQKKNQICF